MSLNVQNSEAREMQEIAKRRFDYEKTKKEIKNSNASVSIMGGFLSGLGGLLSGVVTAGTVNYLADVFDCTIAGDIFDSGIFRVGAVAAAAIGVTYCGCRFFINKSKANIDEELSKLNKEYEDVLTMNEQNSNIDINS